MGNAAQLAMSAVDKLISGFRPATLRQYCRMWSDFIAFQVAAGLFPYQVNIHLLLAFLEFLHHNGISPSHLQNHLTAIRALHILHGLDTSAFRDERLALFVKVTRLQAPFNPSISAHLDVTLLQRIIQQCDSMQFPVIFKPLYLVVFFSFLRLSNVLPHSVASFDHTRQLARGDVIFGDSGAVLVIKWSKTMQNRKDFTTVSLPDLAGSNLCPIMALKIMFATFKGTNNSPVFLIPRNKGLVPLTDSVACKHLKDISKALSLSKVLTFHDFCSGGAAWAFSQGVPLEHIMKHGT